MKLVRNHPRQKALFRSAVRNAHVYVKGKIKHSDHATVLLKSWHEVMPNLENKARGFQHMAFVD